MSIGFLLAILTGFTWTAIGVVISRCAKDNFDVIAYGIMQTLVTSLLAFMCYGNPARIEMRNLIILTALVFSAGLLNSIAQMIVKVAMGRGNHGPVWAISQSALIIPFLAGVLLWGNHGTLGQWSGTVMIICGILLPVIGRFRDFRQWLLPTLAAFLMFGIIQTLYMAPSQIVGMSDPAGMRPMLAALGGMVGWEIVRRQQRRKCVWNKQTLYLAFFMAVLSVISLKIFFLGLDHLSRAGMGSVGIPLIVGSNIIGFALYSLFILKERLSRIETAGMICVLIGIVIIAF